MVTVMSGKYFSKRHETVYWATIILAPLSIVSVATHVLPIFALAAFSCAFIAAINRHRFSKTKVERSITGVAMALYALSLFTYAAGNLWFNFIVKHI